MRSTSAIAASIAFALACASPARAEEPRGCDKFAWDVGRESAALSTAALPAAASGSSRTISPDAFTLALVPITKAALPMPPERTSRAPMSFAGFVAYPAPEKPGLHQVTLAAAAWIDVVQGGRYLKPVAFSGALDCPAVRKSVRFDLLALPFMLQVSDARADELGLILAPVQPSAKD